MPADHVLVCLEGDRVVLDAAGITREEPTSAAEIYVDGSVGGVDSEVLRQRRLLGVGGFVAIVVTVDLVKRRIIDGPIVESRGWSTDGDREKLHGFVAAAVQQGVNVMLDDADVDADALARVIRRAAGSTVSQRTRRRPVIVPVLHIAR
jgi:ribonuclease J